jgi:hypothetical protein
LYLKLGPIHGFKEKVREYSEAVAAANVFILQFRGYIVASEMHLDGSNVEEKHVDAAIKEVQAASARFEILKAMVRQAKAMA